MKAVIKGTIVGGIIAFIWGAVSWMVLPWHMNTMEHFKSDSSVQATILRNAPKSGVYVIPNPHEFKKDAEEAGDGKIKDSPKERIVMLAAIDIDAKNPYVAYDIYLLIYYPVDCRLFYHLDSKSV